MGIFTKSPKPSPKIIIEGIEFTFHHEFGGWQFKYRDTEFVSFEPALTLPGMTALDSILTTLDALKPEMRTRLQKGLCEWGDESKLDDGETYSVNVQDFASEKSFTVSWAGGTSWGDLGVDFTIRDHAIVDESWGD